jgi:hypothetical protein
MPLLAFRATDESFKKSVPNIPPFIKIKAPPSIFAPYRAAPFARLGNSFFGVVNSVKPQSKQIKSLGYSKMAALSRPSDPGKWIFISASNCA